MLSVPVQRVLDSSAFLSGRQFPDELLTVPEVLGELRRHGVTPQLRAILDTHVRVISPSKEAVDRIRAAAEGTGDAPRLSPVDVQLLALALDTGATLVTDDYSMQNLARGLRIAYETVLAPGIRDEWRWTYRCTGCGRTWPEWHDECPICASPLKTSRPKGATGRRSGPGR